MRNVPQMKRALESLVFRVRELFTVNGIAEAFYLGSLRHKNLDGQEVDSQPYVPIEEELSHSEDPDLGEEDEEEGSDSEDGYSFDS